MFKKNELKLLWPFYSYYFIAGMTAMILPFLIIYFRDLGFSFFQISIITAVVSISAFLFEIPTGAIADGFSRKYSVIIGFLIISLATFLIPFSYNYYFILFTWAIVGIGLTFVSGAEEAWVVDNLDNYNRRDLRHDFFIKKQSISAIGFLLAPLLGTLLVKFYSIKILWYFLGAGYLLNSLLLFLFAKEYFKAEKFQIKKSYLTTYTNSKKGLDFVLSHNIVLILIIAGLFSTIMNFAGDGWQPLLVNLSMPEAYLGILYFFMSIGMIMIPFLSKLFKNMKIKYAISIIILIRMILMLSLLLVISPDYIYAGIIFFFIMNLSNMNDPLLLDYFHNFVPDKIRATVLSVKNMVVQFVCALMSLIAGYLLDLFGPQNTIAFSSLFGIFAIFMYLKLKD